MRILRYQSLKLYFTQMILLATCYLLLATLMGCEAFVKKFTRKPKEDIVKEEPVLVPEDYLGPDISPEAQYREYFLFWKSWQDELITALGSSNSYKKRKDCISQAIKNLKEMRLLVFEETQKELDVYLEKLAILEYEISQDIYGNRLASHKITAERLKRDILRNFSYQKVKNHLR